MSSTSWPEGPACPYLGATWILIPEATVDSCCPVVSFVNSAKSYLSSSMLACLNPGLGTDAETLAQYGGPLG